MSTTITNDDVSLFIALVDEARRVRAPSQNECSGASGATPIDPSAPNNYLESQDLYSQIYKILLRHDEQRGPNIRKLQGALTKRSILDPDLAPYRDVAALLRHGASTDMRFRDFHERDAWIAGIRLTEKLPAQYLSPTIGLEREVAVATAVKKLRNRGYKIIPYEDGFQYQEGELERVCRELNRLAEEIGGYRLLRALFTHLGATASLEQGRYLISRPSRPPTGGNSTPSFPYGYALQMALKHLGPTDRSGDYQKAAEVIGELATDIVASLDIEHYYIMTVMFQTHESLPGYLQDVVVGDHVLTFRQITPKHALTMCRGVFCWIDGHLMRAKLGWGPEEAYLLAERTLTRVPADAINSVFTPDALCSSGLSRAALHSLRKYFAHEPSEINAEYLTPLNADKANAMSRPFVSLSDHSLMMPSPPIASIGFYEAIASGARAVFRNADQQIGDAMEGMLATAFRSQNIIPTITSGKYRVGSDTHECDLVIESQKAVIFIELKKKALTAASYAGNTLSALIDLSLAALNSQLQLGKHELRIREYGEIIFLDGTVVALRHRRVERISVSLLDWGGTQDRLVLQRLAANLVGARLGGSGLTAKQGQDLEEANGTLAELHLQRAQLEKFGVNPKSHFHNWWFLSVPQLLFILDCVSGADAFYDDLILVRGIHTGTIDFYKDFAHWRRMRNQSTGSVPSGPS